MQQGARIQIFFCQKSGRSLRGKKGGGPMFIHVNLSTYTNIKNK